MRGSKSKRSKFLSLIEKNPGVIRDVGEGAKILYLGAGAGTTLKLMLELIPHSHVYAVEIAPKPMRRLLSLFKGNERVIPILEDANHPERYSGIVEKVDMIYQDVAQPNQADIAIKNARYFLDRGLLIMMCKLKSIDFSAPHSKIVNEVRRELEEEFKIDEVIKLPYHKDHVCFVARRRYDEDSGA